MHNHIAGYLRISVDSEMGRENTSIENQRAIIESYVKSHFPGEGIDFFEDKDRSGYTFEQRENYQRMRKFLIEGYYNILIIKDFSRFSRRNSRGLVELEDLRDAGIRIISVSDSVDYPTYDDWQNIQVRFLINEFPVTDTSKKMRLVIENRQKDGKWICGVPYGYRLTNSKKMIYQIVEHEAEIVRKIFDLYIKGAGYSTIANYLSDNNIPTPRNERITEIEKQGDSTTLQPGEFWAKATVRSIIMNDFYIGTLRQKKTYRKRINSAGKPVDPSEQIVFKNYHEGIIDEKVFKHAQKLRTSKKALHTSGYKKFPNPYPGLLQCGDCGYNLWSKASAVKDAYYNCRCYIDHKVSACFSHKVKTKLLNLHTYEYIQGAIKSIEIILQYITKNQINTAESPVNSDVLNSLEQKLNTAKEELKMNKKCKNKELMMAGLHYSNPEELNRQMALIEEIYKDIESQLEEEIKNIEEEIDIARNEQRKKKELLEVATYVLEGLKDVPKDLESYQVKYIIERIVVYKDSLKVKLCDDVLQILNLTCPGGIKTTLSPTVHEENFVTKEVREFQLNDSPVDKILIFSKAIFSLSERII